MKGELIVEVFIDKKYARRNGDAWRTILDACLPVMHLVDTRRSIAYGIKQVEDILGICCSFEQSVQVDKHETYTESSCFFVVSTDGSRSDFSYIKCLMNLVKQKFPEHDALSFNSRFFKKRSAPAPAPADSTQQ